jgi:uncharacterized membrane protein YbhN (UPF0104 family)
MTKRAVAGVAVAGKLALTAALLWWLSTRVDIGDALAALGRFDPAFIAAALLVALVQVGLAGWRFMLVTRLCGTRIGVGFALRATLVGGFFSQLLVTFISGDAIRAWMLARRGMALGRAVEAALLDRVIGVIALTLLILVGFAQFLALLPNETLRTSAILLLAAAWSAVFAFLILGRASGLCGRLLGRWPWLASLASTGRHLFTDSRAAGLALALGLVVHLLSVAMFILLFRGLGLPISTWLCLAVVPMVMLITMIPVSIAGWGLRESAMVVAFAGLNLPDSDILAASIAFGLLILAASLPGAVLWLNNQKRFGEASGGQTP